MDKNKDKNTITLEKLDATIAKVEKWLAELRSARDSIKLFAEKDGVYVGQTPDVTGSLRKLRSWISKVKFEAEELDIQEMFGVGGQVKRRAHAGKVKSGKKPAKVQQEDQDNDDSEDI